MNTPSRVNGKSKARWAAACDVISSLKTTPHINTHTHTHAQSTPILTEVLKTALLCVDGWVRCVCYGELCVVGRSDVWCARACHIHIEFSSIPWNTANRENLLTPRIRHEYTVVARQIGMCNISSQTYL